MGTTSTQSDPADDTQLTIRLLQEVTGLDEPTVRARLSNERWHPGSTVRRDMRRRGVKPHEWTDGLLEFYGATDAFLFELAVWNRNRLKQAMRRYVARALWGDAAEVLCLGDGLGFDSLALHRQGHRVTYFEVPGLSYRFAEKLFAHHGAAIRMVSNEHDLGESSYDAVLCLDVLEHVPDPKGFARTIAWYLKPGGLAIVNAPFHLILPAYGTHLRANRRHAGSLRLFERAGLQLQSGSLDWAPLVLRKGEAPRAGGAWRAAIRAMGLLLHLGRYNSFIFRTSDVTRWLTNRGF